LIESLFTNLRSPIKFGGDATGVPNEATRGGLAVGLAEMEIKFSIISGLVGL